MTSRLRNLWDSDEGEQQNHENTVQIRIKPSLFDSTDSEKEPTKGSLEEVVDYKPLYLYELEKRKAAEAEIVKLSKELTALKDLVTELQTLQHVETGAMNHSDEEEERNGGHEQQSGAFSTEWEVLAREEREHRRHKIRALQAKQRTQVASKRIASKPGTIRNDEGPPLTHSTTIGVDVAAAAGPPLAGSSIGAAATAVGGESGRSSGNHYLDTSDSSNGEDGDERGSLSPPMLDAPTAASTRVAAADIGDGKEEVDPEEAKWRELAAQERQRRALARRSVRTVRRVGAAEAGEGSGSLEGTQARGGGLAGKARPAVRQRHLRGSQLHSAVATGSLPGLGPGSGQGGASSAVALTTARGDASTPTQFTSIADSALAAGQRAGTAGADCDSDWDSDSDGESSAGGGPSSAALVQSTPFPAASEEPPLTVAAEAAMDVRLRRWAATRSLPALLCAVPDVLQHSAGAVKMADLHSALAPLRQASGIDSADHWAVTRMAYMRVIRCCHPDKHMDLPPRSAAFLELQKVFTALCEAYKTHKSAVGSS